jgi:hypothetical protein
MTQTPDEDIEAAIDAAWDEGWNEGCLEIQRSIIMDIMKSMNLKERHNTLKALAVRFDRDGKVFSKPQEPQGEHDPF